MVPGFYVIFVNCNVELLCLYMDKAKSILTLQSETISLRKSPEVSPTKSFSSWPLNTAISKLTITVLTESFYILCKKTE